MDTVNILEFVAISAITLVLYTIITYKSDKDLKLMCALSCITIFVYSGIGISFHSVSNTYMIHYSIFLSIWLVTMRIISLRTNLYKVSTLDKMTNEVVEKYGSLYKTLTVCFFITQFVYLVVPEFRLFDFFKPQKISIVGYFDKNMQNSANSILNICSTFNLILQPFFFLYLNQLLKEKKKKRAFVLCLLWVYTDYLKINYISRYQMVIYFLFIYFLIFCSEEKRLKISLKHIAVLIIIALISIPFLSSFTETRMGLVSEEKTFGQSIQHLIDSECGYPKNFELILENTDAIKFTSYLKWIFWLPVPSFLYPGKPTLSINSIYTYLRTGLIAGDSGFSIVLPSLLGESFMVWDRNFYWLTAIIVAIIIILFHKFCKKYDSLYVIDLYFIVKILVLGRGGTASLIPELINSNLFIILWILFIKSNLWRNRKIN